MKAMGRTILLIVGGVMSSSFRFKARIRLSDRQGRRSRCTCCRCNACHFRTLCWPCTMCPPLPVLRMYRPGSTGPELDHSWLGSHRIILLPSASHIDSRCRSDHHRRDPPRCRPSPLRGHPRGRSNVRSSRTTLLSRTPPEERGRERR